MVLVARGSEAYPILRTLTPLEKIPANAVAGKIKKIRPNFGLRIVKSKLMT